MKVLFAAFEAAPFAKTGGLGDVAGTLPTFLKKAGTDIRVILPKHDCIPDELKSKMKTIASFHILLGWRTLYCGLQELKYQGITYYFIDNEYYFKRGALYGYDDDDERVAFFCKAVLESLSRLEKFKPQIIHCNDWHTSLIPVMLKEFFGDHPFYYDVKTVMTIHNLKFQGIFSDRLLWDLLGMGGHTAAKDHMSWEHGAINYMKGGLLYSDAITTVSPTYAAEIQTSYYGEGLDGVLRWRSDQFCGILNGIDYDVYDPAKDNYLVKKYECGDWAKKALSKADLQASLNLPESPDTPLLAMVTRLTEQKGMDLVGHILEELLSQHDIQLGVLGSGDASYEDMLLYFASRYPDKMSVRLGFDDGLAHKLYAGSDMFIMPSRFEPCGISQMIAMRYGTLPIVRETGGLKDTVTPYNHFTGEGNGFSFANFNAHELLFAIQRAMDLYKNDPSTWQVLQANACKEDFSWTASAGKYAELYNEMGSKKK